MFTLKVINKPRAAVAKAVVTVTDCAIVRANQYGNVDVVVNNSEVAEVRAALVDAGLMRGRG